MSELKSCPFCGGEAEYRQFANPRNYYAVYCTSCSCRTDGYNCGSEGTDAENKVMQAEIWNRRPEPRLLTLGELQEMDGQPVWVNVLVDDYPGEWALASEFCKGATTGASVFQYDNYGVIWAAYDRQPGGDIHGK